MNEQENRQDKRPDVILIMRTAYKERLVEALLEQKFENIEPGNGKVFEWGDDYAWYRDSSNNIVIIQQGKYRGEWIVNCPQSCLPVIADTFDGIDRFRRARDEDYA